MRDLDFGKELIRKKIPLVSNSPGVYRMLDKKDQVIYVGKAKNLPNRLKSYTLDKSLTTRTERMIALTNNLEIIIIGVITSIFCQLGDLLFSFLKRKAKVKDTGNFLPGHGGVLDRLDGIFLGIPFGFFSLILLN